MPDLPPEGRPDSWGAPQARASSERTMVMDLRDACFERRASCGQQEGLYGKRRSRWFERAQTTRCNQMPQASVPSNRNERTQRINAMMPRLTIAGDWDFGMIIVRSVLR
jgi:hypothetical protein